MYIHINELYSSLVTRLSPLSNYLSLCVRRGESLVCFDHVLDVVECGYRLVVDFAHTHALLALQWICVHGQNWPLNGNHVQPHPAHDQNIPGSPPSPYTQINLNNRIRGESLGYEASYIYSSNSSWIYE